jgi:hypothetical protein
LAIFKILDANFGAAKKKVCTKLLSIGVEAGVTKGWACALEKR